MFDQAHEWKTSLFVWVRHTRHDFLNSLYLYVLEAIEQIISALGRSSTCVYYYIIIRSKVAGVLFFPFIFTRCGRFTLCGRGTNTKTGFPPRYEKKNAGRNWFPCRNKTVSISESKRKYLTSHRFCNFFTETSTAETG